AATSRAASGASSACRASSSTCRPSTSTSTRWGTALASSGTARCSGPSRPETSSRVGGERGAFGGSCGGRAAAGEAGAANVGAESLAERRVAVRHRMHVDFAPLALDIVRRVVDARPGARFVFVFGTGCCEGTAPHLFADHHVGPTHACVGNAGDVLVYADDHVRGLYAARE